MIGGLRNRVQLQTKARTVSASGAVSEAWTTVATIWARMEPMTGSESRNLGRATGQAGWKMTARSRPDFTVSARIVWKGRNFDITRASNPDERSFYSVLELIEQVS